MTVFTLTWQRTFLRTIINLQTTKTNLTTVSHNNDVPSANVILQPLGLTLKIKENEKTLAIHSLQLNF